MVLASGNPCLHRNVSYVEAVRLWYEGKENQTMQDHIQNRSLEEPQSCWVRSVRCICVPATPMVFEH